MSDHEPFAEVARRVRFAGENLEAAETILEHGQVPRTACFLDETRERIEASSEPLLSSWEEIDCELAELRGGDFDELSGSDER